MNFPSCVVHCVVQIQDWQKKLRLAFGIFKTLISITDTVVYLYHPRRDLCKTFSN